jgi:hypothetical protein
VAFGDLAPEKAPPIIHRVSDNLFMHPGTRILAKFAEQSPKRILSLEILLKKSDLIGSGH